MAERPHREETHILGHSPLSKNHLCTLPHRCPDAYGTEYRKILNPYQYEQLHFPKSGQVDLRQRLHRQAGERDSGRQEDHGTFGGGSVKKNGVYDQVVAALKGRDFVEFWGIELIPKSKPCAKPIAQGKAEKVDFCSRWAAARYSTVPSSSLRAFPTTRCLGAGAR